MYNRIRHKNLYGNDRTKNYYVYALETLMLCLILANNSRWRRRESLDSHAFGVRAQQRPERVCSQMNF